MRAARERGERFEFEFEVHDAEEQAHALAEGCGEKVAGRFPEPSPASWLTTLVLR